jgi:hypothetical protein
MSKKNKPRKITAQIRKRDFPAAVDILERRLSESYLQGWDDGVAFVQDARALELTQRYPADKPRRIVNRVASTSLNKPVFDDAPWRTNLNAALEYLKNFAALDPWSITSTRFTHPHFFSPEVIEENRQSTEAVARIVKEDLAKEKELDLDVFYGRKSKAEWTPSVHGESFKFDPTKHWTEHNAIPEEPSVRAWLEAEKAKKEGI